MNPDRFLRTFDVLDALADAPDGLRLTEISQAVGAPVSSTHNLLQTMLAAEIIAATDDLHYTVGPRAVRIGIKIMNSLEVRTLGRRHLERLAKTLGNDVYLAVRVGDRIVYVDRFRGTQAVSVNIRIGDSLALHATAAGKLYAAYEDDLRARVLARPQRRLTSTTITEPELLEAEFDRIRQRGLSVSREEGYPGIFGIAVPVRDAAGTMAAAIHVSALSAGLDTAREDELIEQSQRTAADIQDDLGVPDLAELDSPGTAAPAGATATKPAARVTRR
ncbi:IclR family transcriptional regulator [Rhodococcus jostii]|uniref:DNA-binding transcriptional regulator, IclR family n=1 Tax=Rhodococcus jostii TaxID=132919 RepID=A0A1H4XB82_RHOJO|nr:IclR family transcriptional regulator [Rhodococcus jostii]SED03012.1 DNA-binding transcriptional regulator, IclR family [Rhodococcus jostii]